MKKLGPVLALLVVLVIAALLKDSLAPSFHHPLVVIDAPGGIRLNILQRGQKGAQCSQAVTTQLAAIQGSCPACRIVESRCVSRLSDMQRQWFGEAPLGTPSARMANGIIVYEAPDVALALQACQESERQARVNPPSSRVACNPAGAMRPLPAAERQKMVESQAARQAFFLAISALAGALAVLLVIGYFMRRSFDAATTPPTDSSLAHLPRVPTFPWTQKLVLVGVDALILLAAFALLGFPRADDAAAWVRYDLNNLAVHIALTTITVGWFWTGLEHYGRRRPFWDELREVFRALSVVFLLAGATVFYAGLDTGRGMYLWIWALTFILLPLGRATAKGILDTLRLWRQPAVIIGTGENARDAYLALKSEGGMGYEIIAFVAPGNVEGANSGAIAIKNERRPVILPTAGIEALLAQLDKPRVVLALETLSTPETQTLVQRLATTNHNIHVIPAIRGLPLFGTQLSHFFSHEVLFLTLRSNLSRRTYRWTKRVFDIVAASLLSIVLSPLMLYVAWRIWREDGRPIIFHQPRLAREQGEFPFLKFRSMVKNADQILMHWKEQNSTQWREYVANNFKLANDPRLLSVGRWLRATSIDELPQLFNVLRGEMSLVGPRPLLARELAEYGDAIHLYTLARPGLTGLWQVSGRSSTTFADRANLDAWYVQNWSLWYDIAILFKTVDVVLNRRGAY